MSKTQIPSQFDREYAAKNIKDLSTIDLLIILYPSVFSPGENNSYIAKYYPTLETYLSTITETSRLKDLFPNEELAQNLASWLPKYDLAKSALLVKHFWGKAQEDADQDKFEIMNLLLTIPTMELETFWQDCCSTVSSHFSYTEGEQYLTVASKIYSKTKAIVDSVTTFEMSLAKATTVESYIEYLKHLRRLFHKAKDLSHKTSYFKLMVALFERAIYLFCKSESFDDLRSLFVEALRIIQSIQYSQVDTLNQFIITFVEQYAYKFVGLMESDSKSWSTFFDSVPPESVDMSFYTLGRIFIGSSILNGLSYSDYAQLACQILLYETLLASRRSDFDPQDLTNDLYTFFKHQQSENLDPAISVERLVIEICVQVGDLEKAKYYCVQLAKNSPHRHWTWLKCIETGRRAGDVEFLRKIFNLAIDSAMFLEWPEPIFEEYLYFEKLNGDSKSYLDAQKKVNYSLERLIVERGVVEVEPEASTKRKLDEEQEPEVTKKPKKESVSRDREHLRVIIEGFEEASESELRGFFSDCGDVKEVIFLSKGKAILELQDEKQVLAALTKTYKIFKGHQITVSRAQINTVFVTNFSPLETEETMKAFFGSVGKILSVRFPSLKYNSDRRFCYVEYFTPEAAQKAVEQFDGTHSLRKEFSHPLSVKLSDPKAKKERDQTSVEEGREVHINGLDFFKVEEHTVSQLFSKYGEIERVKLPLSHKGKLRNRKNDGYGFVLFADPECAEKAVAELNMSKLYGRVIEVSISSVHKKNKFKKVVESFDSKPQNDNIEARMVVLFNLPDTINASQLMEYLSQKIGPVNKVDLRSKESKALVEFRELKDAGKAGLVLQGESLNGSILRVGDRSEWVKEKPVKMVPTNVLRRKRR